MYLQHNSVRWQVEKFKEEETERKLNALAETAAAGEAQAAFAAEADAPPGNEAAGEAAAEVDAPMPADEMQDDMADEMPAPDEHAEGQVSALVPVPVAETIDLQTTFHRLLAKVAGQHCQQTMDTSSVFSCDTALGSYQFDSVGTCIDASASMQQMITQSESRRVITCETDADLLEDSGDVEMDDDPFALTSGPPMAPTEHFFRVVDQRPNDLKTYKLSPGVGGTMDSLHMAVTIHEVKQRRVTRTAEDEADDNSMLIAVEPKTTMEYYGGRTVAETVMIWEGPKYVPDLELHSESVIKWECDRSRLHYIARAESLPEGVANGVASLVVHDLVVANAFPDASDDGESLSKPLRVDSVDIRFDCLCALRGVLLVEQLRSNRDGSTNWRFTSKGFQTLVDVTWMVFNPQPVLRARSDVPTAELTIYELIDILHQDGFACQVLAPKTQRRSVIPYQLGENNIKLWFMRFRDETVHRSYLIALKDFQSLSNDGMQCLPHLLTEEFYHQVLTDRASIPDLLAIALQKRPRKRLAAIEDDGLLNDDPEGGEVQARKPRAKRPRPLALPAPEPIEELDPDDELIMDIETKGVPDNVSDMGIDVEKMFGMSSTESEGEDGEPKPNDGGDGDGGGCPGTPHYSPTSPREEDEPSPVVCPVPGPKPEWPPSPRSPLPDDGPTVTVVDMPPTVRPDPAPRTDSSSNSTSSSSSRSSSSSSSSSASSRKPEETKTDRKKRKSTKRDPENIRRNFSWGSFRFGYKKVTKHGVDGAPEGRSSGSYTSECPKHKMPGVYRCAKSRTFHTEKDRVRTIRWLKYWCNQCSRFDAGVIPYKSHNKCTDAPDFPDLLSLPSRAELNRNRVSLGDTSDDFSDANVPDESNSDSSDSDASGSD